MILTCSSCMTSNSSDVAVPVICFEAVDDFVDVIHQLFGLVLNIPSLFIQKDFGVSRVDLIRFWKQHRSPFHKIFDGGHVAVNTQCLSN